MSPVSLIISFNPFWDATENRSKRHKNHSQTFNPFWDATYNLGIVLETVQNKLLSIPFGMQLSLPRGERADRFFLSIPFGMQQEKEDDLLLRSFRPFNPFWDATQLFHQPAVV